MERTQPGLPDLDLESLARLCVRHPGSRYPDLLARAASGGRLGADDLRALARAVAEGREARLGRLDPTALGWLATVGAASVGAGTSLADVCDQLLLAHRTSGEAGLAPRFRGLLLDSLFLSGRSHDYPYPREDADPTSPGWRVRVDALNPFLGGPAPPSAEAGTARWLTALSEVFTVSDLAPLRLAPGASTPLSRVGADVPAPSADDRPLVTVVLPLYDPGEDLRFSVASILRQSWGRLELLLCDDGSGPGTQALLEELAGGDPRVRVLHNPVNTGAYAAMNLGLAAARGDLVTFHGADDWAHPERLRTQAEALLRDPALLGTTSSMVRVDPNLGLTVLGYPAVSANASSLLFRRQPVLDRLGGLDTVRRAADNEFLGRLRAAFGDGSVLAMDVVLALVQRTPGSLSRDDLRLLYRHPSREHYRFCYRQWHGLVRQGQEDPFVAPPDRPPVPATGRVSGAPEGGGHRADLLLLGGFSPSTPTTPDLPTEVAALRGAGSLALLSFPSPVDLTVPARRPPDEVVQLIRTGAAAWVLPDDRVTTSLAVVRDPAAVPYLAALLGSVRARTVLLVVGEDPTGRFDPAGVAATVREAVGATPLVRWLPATAGLAAVLARHVPAEDVLAARPWGAVPEPAPGSWDRAPRAEVGVLAPSTSLRPPRLAAWAERNVPRDPATTLVCRTGGPRLPRRLGRSVESLRGSGTTHADFLDRMSYLVAPPVPGRRPHLHPGVVEALLHGCVVLLEPSYRGHFGDAALYTDDLSVDEWIARHRDRPGEYAEQQDRAADFLRSRLGADRLRRTVQEVHDLAGTGGRDGWPALWRRARTSLTGRRSRG